LNSEFQTIARDIPGAKTLDLAPDDAGDLWFNQSHDRYANGWLYLLRATRDDQGEKGFLINRDGFQVGLGYRNKTIYLVRPSGTTAVKNIREICRYLQERSESEIILKKVDEDLAQALECEDFFDSSKYIREQTLLEDEFRPELYVDLNELFPTIDTINPKARNLSRKVTRFLKASSICPEVHELHDDLMTVERIHRFLSKHQTKAKAYRLVVEAVCRANSRGPYISTVYQDSKSIEGVYVAERLSARTAGLYCAVTSKSAVGMTEWMDVSFFRKLHAMGITKLLLGGCETDGVRAYCNKLLAQSASYVTQTLVFKRPHGKALPELSKNAESLAAA
jgi:hypothetical protein